MSSDAEYVETVVVGNGPAALILSFVLHGNIPRYRGGHWDAWLDKKLRLCTDLLHIPPDVYGRLQTSIKYSVQALPFNVLLDTLLRPDGDLSTVNESCVRWDHEPKHARPHLVIGSAPEAGGQWADEPDSTCYEIGTLSYTEQLSLPAYSFKDHWKATKGSSMPELIRPTRADCSSYYATYPAAAGIAGSFRMSTKVSEIHRTRDGFFIASHNIKCKFLVLASGTFNSTIEPPPSLATLRSLSCPSAPLLVVGSGFTAADIIISTPANRKIIHVFHWDPDNRPSPLRACHSSAYPEYAYIYKQMKMAATRHMQLRRQSTDRTSYAHRPPKPLTRLPHFSHRDWVGTYEGHANTRICVTRSRHIHEKGSFSDNKNELEISAGAAIIQLHGSSKEQSDTREIGGFYYAAGRRGTLTFLEPSLLDEVVPPSPTGSPHPDKVSPWVDADVNRNSELPTLQASKSSGNTPLQHLISGQTLREKIMHNSEGQMNIEVARNVFAVGSLTGDSLVRFAFGGCCLAAGKIMDGGH